MQKRKEGEEKKKVSRPKESRPETFFSRGGRRRRECSYHYRSESTINLRGYTQLYRKYYLFSMITTVIDPLFDLSNYSSLHCSFRICLSPKICNNYLEQDRAFYSISRCRFLATEGLSRLADSRFLATRRSVLFYGLKE